MNTTRTTMTVARLFTPMLACLATGCTSGSQRAPGVTQAKEVDQRTSAEVSPQTMPEFTKIVISVKTLAADTEWVRMPLVDVPGSQFKVGSWKNHRLDQHNSFVQCGHQRRGVEHSGDSFAVSDPISFRMVGTDPLSYAKDKEATLPLSRSVIWVEPGDDPQSVIVTTDPRLIDSFAQAATGIERQAVPDLKLEFYVSIAGGGGYIADFLFGEGSAYWGATKGPVRLNGKTYRNLRGARVANGQLLGR